jgi:hypothetical protein
VTRRANADIITFAFRFIQPTTTNRAILTIPIPAGFAKINL